MRISDWSSDVCSSDLRQREEPCDIVFGEVAHSGDLRDTSVLRPRRTARSNSTSPKQISSQVTACTSHGWKCASAASSWSMRERSTLFRCSRIRLRSAKRLLRLWARSEEHTSELQSLMRISYAVFCLKKKNNESRRKQQNKT